MDERRRITASQFGAGANRTELMWGQVQAIPTGHSERASSSLNWAGTRLEGIMEELRYRVARIRSALSRGDPKQSPVELGARRNHSTDWPALDRLARQPQTDPT